MFAPFNLMHRVVRSFPLPKPAIDSCNSLQYSGAMTFRWRLEIVLERNIIEHSTNAIVDVQECGKSGISGGFAHGSGLTVELSGAHADAWSSHFIFHAAAPAIC
jgi:hypothetical protein